MFVQFIQGRVSDRHALKARMDQWIQDLKPGAEGWLGSTAGVTEDGRAITMARFESEKAARNNSDRPEQGEWWAQTERLFDGEVTFHDSTEVETGLQGGSDDAGFVQVIQGRATDPARVKALFKEMAVYVGKNRPEVIGWTVGWYGDGGFTEFVYFTSEADARAGERRMEGEDERNTRMEEWRATLDGDPEFYDLKDPWMWSA